MPDVFRCLRCEYWCAYSTHFSAHQAAGALGTRHSPRPCLQRATSLQNSRACDAAEREGMFVEGMFVVARDRAAFSTVIVRLDRTIQYSGTPMTDPRGRGVLDTRLRGY